MVNGWALVKWKAMTRFCHNRRTGGAKVCMLVNLAFPTCFNSLCQHLQKYEKSVQAFTSNPRGHTTTIWSKFYPILTTCLLLSVHVVIEWPPNLIFLTLLAGTLKLIWYSSWHIVLLSQECVYFITLFYSFLLILGPLISIVKVIFSFHIYLLIGKSILTC